MSRIGKKPIEIPQGGTINAEGEVCKIKGPKGELHISIPSGISIKVEGGKAFISQSDGAKKNLYGLTRVLVQNAVVGVTQGYTKRLEVSGVGYRIAVKDKNLELEVGFSHPVVYTPPKDITLAVEEKNVIVVAGIDKQKVGQVAAEIRAIKPPDPYKAKGIKHAGEHIRKKVGKVGA